MERKVVRVLTPGTLTDEALLDSKQENLLVAISRKKDQYGLAVAEISSGRFDVCQHQSLADLLADLARLQPAEILIDDSHGDTLNSYNKQLKFVPEWHFGLDAASFM